MVLDPIFVFLSCFSVDLAKSWLIGLPIRTENGLHPRQALQTRVQIILLWHIVESNRRRIVIGAAVSVVRVIVHAVRRQISNIKFRMRM
jgi:hypothetical protein